MAQRLHIIAAKNGFHTIKVVVQKQEDGAEISP